MRIARMFAKQFLFDFDLSCNTEIENMDTIFYCTVKSTFVTFLVYNLSNH